MNCAVKLGSKSPQDKTLRRGIFDALAGAYLPLVPRLQSAADCIIPLFACSRAEYWGPASADGKGGLAVALLQRLSADGCTLMRDEAKPVKEQDHANLWLALATAPASVRAKADLRRLLEASAEGLFTSASLSFPACSIVLQACVRLKWKDARLVTHLAACLAASSRSASADCQALANSVYALGELAESFGVKPRPEDLQGLVGEAVARLRRAQGDGPFSPQHLGNMLLGLANLGYVDLDLRIIVAAARANARRMSPQDVVNALTALELLQPSVNAHAGAVEALAEACSRTRFKDFNAQTLVACVSTLAKMGFADQAWYGEAVAAAEQAGMMRAAKAHEWANLWHALAVARHRPASRRLLDQTAEAAAGVISKEANPQDCANLLWALATLRLSNEGLVDALAGRLAKLLGQDPKQVKTPVLCNSLWALAVMGPEALSRHSGLVEGLLRDAERRWAADGSAAFGEQTLTQLWQVQLELAHVGAGELQRVLGTNEGSLLASARAAALSDARLLASCLPTSLEAEVSSALELLREQSGPGAIVSVQRRCVVEEAGRYAEAVVELAGGRRVAVDAVESGECCANGPPPNTVLGPTGLRYRQLERSFGKGNLAVVPHWEWAEAKAKKEAGLRAYLSRRLGLEAPSAGTA